MAIGYFQELNDILNKIIEDYLLTNQNLCKLLYYYPTESDYLFNPLAQPDIINTNILLMDYIYPLPKSPDSQTEKKCFMTISMVDGVAPDNSSSRVIRIIFDIVCHLDAWMIKRAYRPLSVLAELDGMFNEKITNFPIIGKTRFGGFAESDYSNYFYGFQVAYDMTVPSNAKCS